MAGEDVDEEEQVATLASAAFHVRKGGHTACIEGRMDVAMTLLSTGPVFSPPRS